MIFVPPRFFQGRRLRPCFNGVDAPALACLHWLRVPERIEYKVAVLTYKVLHGNFREITSVANLLTNERTNKHAII